VKVVVILNMNCFLVSPAALSVRLPDKVTADVGKVYTPASRVIPPRFDDGSAAVAVIDRALCLSQWLFSLADIKRKYILVVSRETSSLRVLSQDCAWCQYTRGSPRGETRDSCSGPSSTISNSASTCDSSGTSTSEGGPAECTE
jgi:hypothetical protein